jgi:LacI family transcriptional regulator
MKSCREARYHLVVESVSPDTIADREALGLQLHGLQVDGLAVLPPLCDNLAIRDELEQQDIPYTRIAPTIELGRSSAVIVDDDGAVREMVRHLWSLGHRRIGFITGSLLHLSAYRRREAFVSEMAALVGQPAACIIEQGDFSFDSGIAAGGRLLDRSERPTAIFASNDEMAAGVIAAAMMRKLTLPDDLSVCGFDDSAIARFTWPPLTTIAQPLGKMAGVAIAQLLDRPEKHMHQRLDLKLVIRASTAPPRAS